MRNHQRLSRAHLLRGLVLVIWLGALGLVLWSGPEARAAVNTYANTTSISIGPGAGPCQSLSFDHRCGLVCRATSWMSMSPCTASITTVPDDLDVLLVGPGGQSVILTSDACGNLNPGGADFTFDDEASGPLPDTDGGTPCATGTYQPWNYSGSGGDGYNAPAPRWSLRFDVVGLRRHEPQRDVESVHHG
ncbi:MAG: hypothetical protein KatS3mg051_1657 [Anaerolineae bacterium]|nr:MAG: hypothetical protein KatS3mg051_1657 [Anaerolineae bacterium]